MTADQGPRPAPAEARPPAGQKQEQRVLPGGLVIQPEGPSVPVPAAPRIEQQGPQAPKAGRVVRPLPISGAPDRPVLPTEYGALANQDRRVRRSSAMLPRVTRDSSEQVRPLAP